MSVKATILVPTTKHRGVLLPFSIGSILQQTIKEIEIFIIGDGVDASMREVIRKLIERDNRIKFFDHPKGTRRGETYRHEALMNHAKGEIVCYLLDRDLMLPDHVEKMYENLQKFNFCTHIGFDIKEDGSVHFQRRSRIGEFDVHPSKFYHKVMKVDFTFSPVGHTLDFYKSLPYGWRTTPSRFPTDIYMWKQFIDHPAFRFLSSTDNTILYFKRGDHPGWSADKRAAEISKYYSTLSNKKDFQSKALFNLIREFEALKGSYLLIKGFSLMEIPKKIFLKIKSILTLKRL